MPPHTAPPDTSTVVADHDPIHVSVANAATMLGVSVTQMYRLLDRRMIECRYFGRRRLVRVDSLRAFADGLPVEPPG